MANEKTFPSISASELISQSWSKLLTRDASVRTQFSGTEFPTVTSDDVGQPCFRTDIGEKGTWYIFIGMDTDGSTPVWWDPFGTLSALDINLTPGSDFPSTTTDVDKALRFLANKNLDNAIVFPPDSLEYVGDGTTTTYLLNSVSTNKNTVNVYISGVKQSPSTYDLSTDGMKVIFKEAPAYNETILLQENSSVLNYDLMPLVKTFTGDGSTLSFDVGVSLVSVNTIEVNVDNKVLLKDEFSVDGTNVVFKTAPVSGAKIQVESVYKGSLSSPSANSVTTSTIQDNSITSEKLVDSSVTLAKLADNSVSDIKIINGSVKTNKIADGAVTEDKLAAGSVTSTKIASDISNKLLGTNTVGTENLKNSSVSMDKLGSDVIQALQNASANVSDATTNIKGVVKLATAQEVISGTGGNKVVTADILHTILAQYHP